VLLWHWLFGWEYLPKIVTLMSPSWPLCLGRTSKNALTTRNNCRAPKAFYSRHFAANKRDGNIVISRYVAGIVIAGVSPVFGHI